MEIAAALASAKTSIEKAHATHAQLIAAQQKNRDLEMQIEDRAKHRLYELAEGKFCYAVEKNEQTGEPAHYLCQNCYDQGIKSILRLVRNYGFGGTCYSCAQLRDGAHDIVV